MRAPPEEEPPPPPASERAKLILWRAAVLAALLAGLWSAREAGWDVVWRALLQQVLHRQLVGRIQRKIGDRRAAALFEKPQARQIANEHSVGPVLGQRMEDA